MTLEQRVTRLERWATERKLDARSAIADEIRRDLASRKRAPFHVAVASLREDVAHLTKGQERAISECDDLQQLYWESESANADALVRAEKLTRERDEARTRLAEAERVLGMWRTQYRFVAGDMEPIVATRAYFAGKATEPVAEKITDANGGG